MSYQKYINLQYYLIIGLNFWYDNYDLNKQTPSSSKKEGFLYSQGFETEPFPFLLTKKIGDKWFLIS